MAAVPWKLSDSQFVLVGQSRRLWALPIRSTTCRIAALQTFRWQLPDSMVLNSRDERTEFSEQHSYQISGATDVQCLTSMTKASASVVGHGTMTVSQLLFAQ